MSELKRIMLQADLTEVLDKWLEKQAESHSFYSCSELTRMMAAAALAICEASTRAEAEARNEYQGGHQCKNI